MTKASGTMFVAENVRLAVRQHGPMTIPEMASVLRWNVKRTARAVKIACGYRWLTVIAKQPSGHFVYGAVQSFEERFDRREIEPRAALTPAQRWAEDHMRKVASR